MFESVLIANRGEIAVRIIRTLRRLGIRSIAVYSSADAAARHVLDADVAHHIGPTPASLSYLSIDRIIDAALSSGAEALHPGYGFLAENPHLASACAEAGIVFIGPPPSAIRAMGDKIRAKETVASRGVRVVPGVSGAGLSDDQLIEQSLGIGFPMLIKPSAGGGGKGMRLVTSAGDLPAQIAAAKREAAGAFGDDTLLIERFIHRPRHIEVQILADSHGNIVHLGERECTLQRRHQKVIEEAPSPLLSDGDRNAIAEQAVAAASACGYVNAGTVEFIVSGDRPDEAFFMEMNTRLQVEHPVTEMVWGVDLVELQLAVAAGERLPFSQADLRPTGHAMEARVYAEDATHDFLPTGGRVLSLTEPVSHSPAPRPNVRVDSSLLAGTDVGSTYDPMLSKVIVWGKDRASARRGLSSALADTEVLGVTTNISFLRTVLDDIDVIAGDMDTSLVERIAARLPPRTTPTHIAVAAAVRQLAAVGEAGPRSAWTRADGWRLGDPAWLTWRARSGDDEQIEVVLRKAPSSDAFDVLQADGTVQRANVQILGERGSIELGNRRTPFRIVVDDDGVLWVGHNGESWSLREAHPLPPGGSSVRANRTSITSPMPGTVIAVIVQTGEQVEHGQAVAVVEAMKMEHVLRSAADGVVAEVLAAVGDRVGLNQPLVIIEPEHLEEPQ